jgi:hypothetical protein
LTTEQDHPDFHLGETRIYGLNERWEGTFINALGLMREIYDKVLKKDAYWHFFWEGSYTVIRHEVGYYSHIKHLVEEYTGTLDVVKVEKGYRENIKMTKKYLDAYIPIFHGYSILALEMEDEDFIEAFERNTHCFLNMATRNSIRSQFKIPGDIAETHTGMGWEAIAIHMLGHMRGWTAGWYNRHFQQKDD